MSRSIPLPRPTTLVTLTACAFLTAGGPVLSQSDDDLSVLAEERPHIEITRVARTPTLADFLDMSAPPELARTMTRVEGFIQRTPQDGAPSSQETHVYLGYDDEFFYAAFVAFDDEPERIRARLGRRENTRGDDTVEIQLDTFHDERRAFSFLCNPLGIQWDALYTEGQRRNFDVAWDTVWHSDGKLTDRGYVVLMRIPFKSLRFDPSEDQVWGLVLNRDIPRNNENTFWPRISSRIEGRLNQGATMSGITDISPGRNIWLIPYGTARNFKLTDSETGEITEDSFDGDAGLDAKLVIKDALTFDLTVNPDFAQVESDQPQVTVNQRFEVRFPEKRPFFLENADFFRTPIELLFTRRIKDPRVGGRLTGKLDGWSLGALVIDDESPGKEVEAGDPRYGDRALFGVVRVQRDIGAQSNLGFMYTHRDFDDESNDVVGLDGRFKLDDNWDTQFQVAHSTSTTRDGEEVAEPFDLSDTAASLVFNRRGRKFGSHIHYNSVGDDFRADSGFIRRTGIQEGHADFSYTFWPKSKVLVNWGASVFGQGLYDFDGLRLDKTVRARLFWEFYRQTRFSFNVAQGRERLTVDEFPELSENTDFSTDSVTVSFNTHFVKSVSFNLNVSTGDSINFVPPDGEAPQAAERFNTGAGLTLRLGRKTRLDMTYLLAKLDEETGSDTIFTNQILRTRLNWQYDPRFSVRLILQYEDTDVDPTLTSLEDDRQFNGDLLLTYLVNPWTAIYLGYNSNYQNIEVIENPDGSTEVVRTDGDLLNDASQVFVKVNYLFQF